MPVRILLAIVILISGGFAAFAQIPATGKMVSINDLVLNRTATTLSSAKRPAGSHTGFVWNSGDNKTCQWRPQGIAGLVTPAPDSRKFLLVSWYDTDREDRVYGCSGKQNKRHNKGVRISFVDVTSMNRIRYRHVLLVDHNRQLLKGVHAGGIAYVKGQLHVAGKGKEVLVFDISKIEELPVKRRAVFHGYRYLLTESQRYEVAQTTSFLGFDWDREHFLTGTFSCYRGGDMKQACVDKGETSGLLWYADPLRKLKSSTVSLPASTFACARMQGAAATRKRVWISTSYGRGNDSVLYWFDLAEISGAVNCVTPGIARQMILPPGLEDLHVAKSSNNLWLLTEFGRNEPRVMGRKNDRIVFAIRRNRF